MIATTRAAKRGVGHVVLVVVSILTDKHSKLHSHTTSPPIPTSIICYTYMYTEPDNDNDLDLRYGVYCRNCRKRGKDKYSSNFPEWKINGKKGILHMVLQV
jgi:hypothetical protein